MNELQKEHHRLTGLFIEMCNNAAQETENPNLVAAALLTAAANYNSYIIAGNNGYLNEPGIDEICTRFRANVQAVQDIRKAEHDEALAAEKK